MGQVESAAGKTLVKQMKCHMGVKPSRSSHKPMADSSEFTIKPPALFRNDTTHHIIKFLFSSDSHSAFMTWIEMRPIILIADDDPSQGRTLEAMVRRFGFETEITSTGENTLARFSRIDVPPISLLILNIALPDMDGMEVLRQLRNRSTLTPVIMQTTLTAIESIPASIRAGAQDFIIKPVGAERLHVSIKNALLSHSLLMEFNRLNRRNHGTPAFKDIISCSDNMVRAIKLGERAATSNVPVLIEGEPGVGKEYFARAIHSASDRKGKAFITVNCATLADELMESVLFGHERNVFGPSIEKQIGKITEASGGTLFLDEISAAPLEIQAKILRFLQEGEIEPLGLNRSLRADARLICATEKNLIELVQRGQFREDLFYRLNVYPITISPLRMRRQDIVELAHSFLMRFAAEEGRKIHGLTTEAKALLNSYDWPGNIRQLENALYRAVVLSESEELTVAEFPQIAARVDGFDVCVPSAPIPTPETIMRREFVQVEIRDPTATSLMASNGEIRKMNEIEADIIRFALKHYRGQMSEIARRLGIGRSTLYRKLKEYNLEASGTEIEASEPSHDSLVA